MSDDHEYPRVTHKYLYAGPDLKTAIANSDVRWSISDTATGLRNYAGVLLDVLRYRDTGIATSNHELTIASCTTNDDEEPFVAAYAGPGTNRAWCLSTITDRYANIETTRYASAAELLRALDNITGTANIIFREGLRGAGSAENLAHSIRFPAWIRQRVRISPSWHTQVDEMRRGTRQETTRLLRKNAFRCRLSTGVADINDFYERLYLPSVERRHGASALVVDKERVLREFRRGVVIQLIGENKVLAAAVLRQIGHTMAVLWTGLAGDPSSAGLRGTTDALDYFSLLYASLKRCRWLDLGRSRPDLRDGLLRYKRKWGAEFTVGFVPQTELRLTCMGRHDSELDFLRRHAFIGRSGRRFHAQLFVDGDITAADLHNAIDEVATPGLSNYRIVTLSPLSRRQSELEKNVPWPISLIEADSVLSAMVAASG